MICPECEGTGKIEKLDRNGFIEVDCPFCYESLGEIDAEECESKNKNALLGYNV